MRGIRKYRGISALLLLVGILGYPFPPVWAEQKHQSNLNFGLDMPQAGEARADSAGLVRFSLATKPAFFRFYTACTAVVGGSLIQGDISIGPQIYFLSFLSKATSVQPHLFGEGTFGVGSFNQKLRYDKGWGLGVGVDLRIFSNSGITIALAHNNCSEKSFRFWFGFFKASM